MLNANYVLDTVLGIKETKIKIEKMILLTGWTHSLTRKTDIKRDNYNTKQ